MFENLRICIARAFKCLGVNQAVAYSVGSRLVQAFLQLLAISLVAYKSIILEQGYYCTFQSLLGLQIFFELGMGLVLVQIICHEAAVLSNGKLTIASIIENDAYRRIGNFLKFTIKWYACVVSGFIAVVVSLGLSFFGRGDQHSYQVNWIFPWVAAVLGTTASMISLVFSAFIEGIGFIEDAVKVRAVQSMVSACTLSLLLYLNFGLYFIGISQLMGSQGMEDGSMLMQIDERTSF